ARREQPQDEVQERRAFGGGGKRLVNGGRQPAHQRQRHQYRQRNTYCGDERAAPRRTRQIAGVDEHNQSGDDAEDQQYAHHHVGLIKGKPKIAASRACIHVDDQAKQDEEQNNHDRAYETAATAPPASAAEEDEDDHDGEDRAESTFTRYTADRLFDEARLLEGNVETERWVFFDDTLKCLFGNVERLDGIGVTRFID